MAGMSRKEKIEYYKRLEAGALSTEDKSKLKMAPMVDPGPPGAVCYTWEEGNTKLREHFNALMSQWEKLPNNVAKERVQENLIRIHHYELASAVRTIALEKKDSRLNKLVDKLGQRKYLEAPNFYALMLEEFDQLPPELQEDVALALKEEVEGGDGVSLDPSRKRMEDAILRELYPPDRNQYTTIKRDIMFKMESPEESYGTGLSMLPTLPVRCRCKVTPLVLLEGKPKITVNDLKVGDIVGAIVSTPWRSYGWNTKLVTKRIKGFEGDVVFDSTEKPLIVPPGHCWIVGDNLKESYDSRHHGAVPLGNLRATFDEIIPPKEPEPAPPSLLEKLRGWFS
jgi:Signal peptidase, peptidase S26